MQVNAPHSSVGPCPISKPPLFTHLLSCSKHTFVKLFQDVSKVQFCFIVTVNPNHFMLISYNLLHYQLSSSLIFISQLNVHLFVDIFIKLDCNKSVCAYIYFPFVLKVIQSKAMCLLTAWPIAMSKWWRVDTVPLNHGRQSPQSPFMVGVLAHPWGLGLVLMPAQFGQTPPRKRQRRHLSLSR